MGARMVFADSLPVFTLQPVNQTVTPGSTATFNVTATGATSYQWVYNGTNITGAMGATLQVLGAQTNNNGYYLAIANNATGWVPSQLVWLSVVGASAGGLVPFSNMTNAGIYNNFGQAMSQITDQPIDGTAQVVAGPALDQMKLITGFLNKAVVTNGFYNPNKNVTVPAVAPGQNVYYAVSIYYTNSNIVYTQVSTVISFTAGGGVYPVDSGYGLKFPAWPEWPEPWISYYGVYAISPPTQTRAAGETFSLTNAYQGYGDFGTPYLQWRKNGIMVGNKQYLPSGIYGGAAQVVLTITNAQPSDAGVYDVDVRGNDWFIGQKIYVSVQTTNGQGVFQAPKFLGTNFVCDLAGMTGRNYKVQQSTNLLNWSDLVTLSNVNGTVTFTNPPAGSGSYFYRTVLVPQ